MKPNKRPDCNCTNCDRSCYKQGPSGTSLYRTKREDALKRLKELKASIGGGQ